MSKCWTERLFFIERLQKNNMKCKCISFPWHIPFNRFTKVFVWKLSQKNYSQLTPLKPKHIKILEKQSSFSQKVRQINISLPRNLKKKLNDLKTIVFCVSFYLTHWTDIERFPLLFLSHLSYRYLLKFFRWNTLST